MSKSLLQIYSLTVCLLATIMLMLSASYILSSIKEISITAYRHSQLLDQYNTNKSFLESHPKLLKQDPSLSAEEVTEMRLQARRKEIKRLIYGSLAALFNPVGMAVVAMLFFFFHWRIYKRDKSRELFESIKE